MFGSCIFWFGDYSQWVLERIVTLKPQADERFLKYSNQPVQLQQLTWHIQSRKRKKKLASIFHFNAHCERKQKHVYMAKCIELLLGDWLAGHPMKTQCVYWPGEPCVCAGKHVHLVRVWCHLQLVNKQQMLTWGYLYTYWRHSVTRREPRKGNGYLLPFLSDVLSGVSNCTALREATIKTNDPPCLTNAAPLPLESDMDYFSCDPHHHQLPCYILPFLAVWSLLLQITVSVIGKVISEISKTETASVAHSVLLCIFFLQHSSLCHLSSLPGCS